MKSRSISIVLGALAAVALAIPASAQWQPNNLPAGELLPAFAGAGTVFSSAGHWSATVWNAQTIDPANAAITTYWYKVTNSAGSADLLTAATLAVRPGNVAPTVGGVPALDFGQWDPTLGAGATAGEKMVSVPTLPFQTTINWAQNAGYPTAGLGAGDTIYLWVRSTLPAGPTVMGLQDTANDHHSVPGPAPEPMSMALVGLGLSAIAGLRKKVRAS